MESEGKSVLGLFVHLASDPEDTAEDARQRLHSIGVDLDKARTKLDKRIARLEASQRRIILDAARARRKRRAAIDHVAAVRELRLPVPELQARIRQMGGARAHRGFERDERADLESELADLLKAAEAAGDQ